MTATAPVPDEVADPFFAAGTVASLVGTHEQVPPAFSAIKLGGKDGVRGRTRGRCPRALEPRTIEVAVGAAARRRVRRRVRVGRRVRGLEGHLHPRARARPGTRAGHGRASGRAAAHPLRWRSTSVRRTRSRSSQSVSDVRCAVLRSADRARTAGGRGLEETAERVIHGAAIGPASCDDGGAGSRRGCRRCPRGRAARRVRSVRGQS